MRFAPHLAFQLDLLSLMQEEVRHHKMLVYIALQHFCVVSKDAIIYGKFIQFVMETVNRWGS